MIFFWVVPFPLCCRCRLVAEATGNHKTIRATLFPPGNGLNEAVIAKVTKAGTWIVTCRWQPEVLLFNFWVLRNDAENDHGCYWYQPINQVWHDDNCLQGKFKLGTGVFIGGLGGVSQLGCARIHWVRLHIDGAMLA